ncbi:16S rRNA (cytidine(1402)-2'-O)-methyltransferase [Candidatus Purcelliella pentastirinorum]|uniref:16S rRNA (cytidine(1402)-2'-O)-methyltransferase n=1 Tax=Candidatus Purcelliella pentastirinorum TaxID=472834 RepID=UPI002A4E2E6E|nr:16S rRNA (cytidine(1402)-2'-O)-methyltransferase [Candidatus Purcelliella pentastirinorum]
MKILKKNKLYIVPTPIGNLKDITYRAINILKKIDIILAENIKHTKILINHFKIKKTILKFNNDYEHNKVKKIIKLIKTGKNVALLSSAGTPTINDPGYKLIHACHLSNIKIIPLPGPCAAITALSASGMSFNKFCYEGFLPKKKNLKKHY